MLPPSPRKIRVLFALSRMGVGGVQRSLLQCLALLDRERFEPRVLLLAGEGEWVGELDRLGVPWEVFPGGCPHKKMLSRAMFRQLPRMLRTLRRLRPDVLHVMQAKPVLFMVLAGRLARVPAVLVQHRSDYRERFWKDMSPTRRFWERFWTRRAHGVAAVSRSVAEASAEGLGLAVESIAVLPNGADVAYPIGGTEAPPPLPEKREGETVVVGVGRLVPLKHWEDLLRAVAQLCGKHPNLRCWLVGDNEKNGGERERLEAMAEELGLADILEMPGFRDDIPALLARADIGALCSEYEGCPNALLEYLAAGLAVVATDIAAVREMVEEGREALLVPVGDADKLAAALDALLSDGKRRAALARAAAETGQRHGWGAAVRRYEDYYESLLGGAGARSGLSD